MTLCPSPITLTDYIEGRIQGKQKEKLYAHVANCKDCMDTIQLVFDLPSDEELKKIKVPKKIIERAKRIPKDYPKA